MTTRLRTLGLGLAVAALTLTGGCGYEQTSAVPKAVTTSAGAAPAPAFVAKPCSDGTGKDEGKIEPSYTPGGTLPSSDDLPAGSTMATIKKRGRLIVGVAADSYLLGFRNTLKSPSVIEGFDIDMAKAIEKAIFGTDDASHIELRVITPADRIPDLIDGSIDIVARNMTINCTRWQQIAFSSPYYLSGQRILVAKGSSIKSLADLNGKRVCAPAGTTSIDNIKKLAPKAIAVTAVNDTGCMVKFQNGDTDALSTDDTVLAGLAAQDKSAAVLGGDRNRLTNEEYGIGVNLDHSDLVQFINLVLEQMRKDGSWQASYDEWLRPSLGDIGAVQPAPQYGRENLPPL